MSSFRLALLVSLLFFFESLLLMPELWFTGQNWAAVLPGVVSTYANLDRRQQNFALLKVDPLLSKAAELKARDMAERSYFSHRGPLGETPWSWFDLVGYDYIYAGENLAVNFYDSGLVHQAWMNSPGHRANILSPKFSDIGVGVAQGTYEGREAVFVVQFLGRSSRLASSTQANLVGVLPAMVYSFDDLWRNFSSYLFR